MFSSVSERYAGNSGNARELFAVGKSINEENEVRWKKKQLQCSKERGSAENVGRKVTGETERSIEGKSFQNCLVYL